MTNIYFFHGGWCKACKEMEPIVDKIPILFEDANIIKIDVDNESVFPILQEYGVRSAPTIVFTDDTGKMLSIARGYHTLDSIADMIEELRGGDRD